MLHEQPTTDSQSPLRIVFLMSRFLDGGIDTVLTEYLKHLAQDDRFQLTLAIATAMGHLEVYAREVPKCVNVVYFSQSKVLTYIPQRRALKQASPLAKAFDELVINPVRRYKARKAIEKLAATTDIFIDFDCCAYSFLRPIHVKKIAFFHFSFAQSMQQNARRMQRIGRELEHYDRVVTISKAMKAEGCQLFPHLKAKLDL